MTEEEKDKKELAVPKPKKPIKPKKPKKFKSDSSPEQGLTPQELEELSRTESEVDVEKKKYICVVHKGPIEGTLYLCPYCQTFYCEKCAKALKLKGDRCWSCNTKITITITMADNLASKLEDESTKELPVDVQNDIQELNYKLKKAEKAFAKGELKGTLKKYEESAILALRAGKEDIAKELTAKTTAIKKLIQKAKEEKKEEKMKSIKSKGTVEHKVFKASVKLTKKVSKGKTTTEKTKKEKKK